MISVPLPDGPGEAISLDSFGPLTTTTNGNKYKLLTTDPCNRRAAIYSVSISQFTAPETAKIFVNDNIPKWVGRSFFSRTMVVDSVLSFRTLFVR